MDSGSTILAVLLVGALLAFAGLRAAAEVLPLLRRGSVRETLGERGLREAAVRRLRSSRYAYEELIDMLTLASTGATSALVLSLVDRETDLAWPLIALSVVGSWAGLLVIATAAEYAVSRAPINKLVIFGVLVQMFTWALLPLRRIFRLGLRPVAARGEGNGRMPGADSGAEHVEPEMLVEEEIADEPLERHERAMIHAILHLDETPVREIMVPRVDVVSLDVTTPLETAVPRMLESGHSRLPVYEADLDNVVGILYSRDLLAATSRGKGSAPPTLRDLVRPCFFVPESKRVDEMLTEFQERRVHLAVVVDEYGSVAGIVTIEDMLGEIVGEIEDEFDVDEPNVEHRDTGDAVVDARMSVDKFNEEFGADINPEGFDTLGGFLFTRLGRIPIAGDQVAEGELRMQVITTVGRRIKKVSVWHQPEAVEARTRDQGSEPA